MSESITKELRSAAVTRSAIRIDAWDSIVVMSESKRDGIADRIDARFTHELTAKQDEMDGLKADMSDLQARLDASMQQNETLTYSQVAHLIDAIIGGGR